MTSQPTIGVQTYIDTVTRLLLVTGLVFEMPFVIMGMAKIGVVTSKQLMGWWRYAILAAVLLAAIVTPSIDPVTQSVVAVPIIILYFVGHRPGEAGRGQQLPRSAARVARHGSAGQPVSMARTPVLWPPRRSVMSPCVFDHVLDQVRWYCSRLPLP